MKTTIIIVVIAIVILGILVSGLPAKWMGFPKIVEVISISSTLTSIEYNSDKLDDEHKTKLYIANGSICHMDIGQTPAPIWAKDNQINNLIVGEGYTFTIEKWSNGVSPFYILVRANPILER